MNTHFIRRIAVCLPLAALFATSATTPASAATARWTCEANALVTTVAGQSPLNPVTALGVPCHAQTVGLPNTTDAIGLAPAINAKSAYALTTALPSPDARPIEQGVASAAGVEGLSIKSADGTVVLGVDAAQSEAAAKCENNQPVMTGSGTVAAITLGGEVIKLDDGLSQIIHPISDSPLGDLVEIRLNEQIKTADELRHRAVHVKVLRAAGDQPLLDVIVAESRVSSASACDPNAIGNLQTPSGGVLGTSVQFPKVCPDGASLDTDRGLCIILAAISGGQGDVIVGRPYEGPSGGKVVSLNVARQNYKSPCLSGGGQPFVVVGTSKGDRITGTNHSDRILGLGGNDRISGGRLHDCMDGGPGNDSLSGSLGRDRAYGMAGNDHLNGGSNADRLYAGAGNDTVNAGFGKDFVSGAGGRDFINIATAGPAASVTCGTGADKVRLNKNESRRVRGCEVSYVFRDK